MWLACRDTVKARLAAERTEAQGAALVVQMVALDLASLQSVGDGFLQSKGAPVSRNRAWQRQLWQISRELTGVAYPD